MTKKTKANLHVVILPFVVSASVEFLPAWLHLPIALICAMSWFGACAMLVEKDQE